MGIRQGLSSSFFWYICFPSLVFANFPFERTTLLCRNGHISCPTTMEFLYQVCQGLHDGVDSSTLDADNQHLSRLLTRFVEMVIGFTYINFVTLPAKKKKEERRKGQWRKKKSLLWAVKVSDHQLPVVLTIFIFTITVRLTLGQNGKATLHSWSDVVELLLVQIDWRSVISSCRT